jgi:hypothetical protein
MAAWNDATVVSAAMHNHNACFGSSQARTAEMEVTRFTKNLTQRKLQTKLAIPPCCTPVLLKCDGLTPLKVIVP